VLDGNSNTQIKCILAVLEGREELPSEDDAVVCLARRVPISISRDSGDESLLPLRGRPHRSLYLPTLSPLTLRQPRHLTAQTPLAHSAQRTHTPPPIRRQDSHSISASPSMLHTCTAITRQLFSLSLTSLVLSPTAPLVRVAPRHRHPDTTRPSRRNSLEDHVGLLGPARTSPPH